MLDLSLGLLGIAGIIMFIDITPICKDWISRIHIGRYDNKTVWSKSITNLGAKWLNNTPKIKVTDNTRFIAIDMLKGNYTKRTIQHWQEAALLLGMSDYLKYNDDRHVQDEIKRFVKLKFDREGQWIDKPEHIDSAILAYAMMKLNFIDPSKYNKALDFIWELIQDHIGVDGTVAYRKSMESYRYVDTLGFICPFLVCYGIKFNKNECIDLAIKQIKEYEKYGMLDKYYIPCHAYELENKVPLGLYGWGRGLGWFSVGLIDTWNELPKDNKHKSVLEQSIKMFAKSVISLQQNNGGWNWTVTRKESRPDSSATAVLGWFLLNAAKLDNISSECLKSAEKAIRYLMKVTRRNGAVDFSQGDTKDIGVYSMLFNILPFSQGFCIRLINSFHDCGKYFGIR
jgi:unsaturated rhamnogalacturonyl hydrolase